MVRWWGFPVLGALLAAATSWTAPATAAEPWSVECTGSGPARRCSASTVQGYANNRGGRGEVVVSLVRDATCTTLHVVFDGPVDLDRPVTLAVDGAARQEFYTSADLSLLAQALDEGWTLRDAPVEFVRFLADAHGGAMAGIEPSDEMLNRFAAVKESRRAGVACAPMRRLLPAMMQGRTLRLEFSAEPRSATQVYHWPGLTRRSADIALDGLAAALEGASIGLVAGH
ncbi:MAG TPA: hypothetical protein VD995_18090 [Azospirillum sp.]|nr:hypothetical protein [Azospirillum sp.]